MHKNHFYSTIGYSRTKYPPGFFDWDTFWQFTSQQKIFNRILYSVHFRHYVHLLDSILPLNPQILELGAGTGIIARRIVHRWGGHATLVDSNQEACRLFLSYRIPGEPLDYILGDIFSLDFPAKFDLVYSDGLIEHFPNKFDVLACHTRALKTSGYLLLFVPNNSFFFRTLTQFGPDMGYEERYTVSDLISLCKQYGLRVLKQTEYQFAVGVLCKKI